MKKIKLLSVTFIMCLCAVLSFAGANLEPKGVRPHRCGPDAMFGKIADDLRLSDEQRTQYDRITAELKDTKKKSKNIKLEEFKSFIGLVNKANISDGDIDSYDKVCADNDIAFQTEIAAKMSELYSILDPNQQKRFIEKMTPPKPDGKAKHGGKKGKDVLKKQKPPKGKSQPKDKKDKFDNDDRRMPHDRFADNGQRPPCNGQTDRGCDKRGHDRMMDHYCEYAPQSMMIGAIARDLRLSKEQSAIYHRIKGEIHDKVSENFAKCDKKDKMCNPLSFLTEGLTADQMNEKIVERVNGQSDTRKFALKKYFEFFGCLTDAQKEVVKLKYQYDIAKMSLPSPNDR
ncbi:MAG: Spy/CpxP family protein refolding chaperone [Spirochaetales bacterium]|nr:Spy/CpxP family protein refolding chaperone [Spirochaetales bacterium]